MGSQLTEPQRRAVAADGHLVIAACPGSGKTTVLKFRAEHLLREAPNARLAAVTFTRDAAKSLQSKIQRQLPGASARLVAGTFHALCISQMGSKGGPRPEILKAGERVRMIGRAMSAVGAQGVVSLESMLEAIERWDQMLEPPRKLEEDEGEQQLMLAAYWRYQDLKGKQVVDFADMIRGAVNGMRADTVSPLTVDYMLVDEFQDTDAMQLEWVMAHVKAGVQVSIVGDDDQAIYGWRGSLGYGGMMRFKEVTDAQQITLDMTFRCPMEILKPAARLIFHNRARIPKQLDTGVRQPGVVLTRACLDADHETEMCVEAILASGDPNRWGVLARTRSQLQRLEAAIGGQFPFVMSAKDGSFWDMRSPALLLSVARSIATFDMRGIEAMLEDAQVSHGYVDEIRHAFSTDERGSLRRFMAGKLPKGGGKEERAVVHEVRNRLGEWVKLAHSKDADDISMALTAIRYFIGNHCGAKARKADDATKDGDLLGMAAATLARLPGSLLERIQRLESQRKQEGGDGARLMTLHGAKGLEFDSVWILGCNQGTLPSAKSDTDEERRLMYVGMTRAKEELYLSYSLKSEPSQFLTEAGVLRGGLLGHDVAAGALVEA